MTTVFRNSGRDTERPNRRLLAERVGGYKLKAEKMYSMKLLETIIQMHIKVQETFRIPNRHNQK